MLPEETQSASTVPTSTLRPGQLAIVATQGAVELQAVGNQVVLSCNYLPKFRLPELFVRYADAKNVEYSLEEMLHDLQNEADYRGVKWFDWVKNVMVRMADKCQTLADGEPTDLRPNCCVCTRRFYMYAWHCRSCNQQYCMWCKTYVGHLEHDLSFLRNDNIIL